MGFWFVVGPRTQADGLGRHRITPFGVLEGSIPNVTFIDLNSMAFAQFAEFFLKRHLFVVFFLLGDVMLNLFHV